MFQRALIYILERGRLYEPARIVCRANISSLKKKIDFLTERIDKCESEMEAGRYAEPVIFAQYPEYQYAKEKQKVYFRRRYDSKEKHSKMLRVMEDIKQKQKRTRNLTSS